MSVATSSISWRSTRVLPPRSSSSRCAGAPARLRPARGDGRPPQAGAGPRGGVRPPRPRVTARRIGRAATAVAVRPGRRASPGRPALRHHPATRCRPVRSASVGPTGPTDAVPTSRAAAEPPARPVLHSRPVRGMTPSHQTQPPAPHGVEHTRGPFRPGRCRQGHRPAGPRRRGPRRKEPTGGRHRAVRFDAATARGRSPLRPPDPALEPQDEAVHLRGAQRDPHHRPGPDRPAPRRRPRVRARDRRPRRPGPVRRHQEAGPGARRPGGDPRQPAVRQQALAGRHAHQLRHDQEADRACSSSSRRASRTATSSG